MKLEWIVHEGKSILYADFRGAENKEAYVSFIHQALKMIKERGGNYLALYNVRGVVLPPGILETITAFTKANNISPSKGAFLGMSSSAELLLKKINGFLSAEPLWKLFTSEKEAREWLVE
jgi:hypothetical protein